MSKENLSVEQKQFLEECESEYIDRYTESDEEYVKIYNSGIPSPPIMFPWYGRSRFNNDRTGGSRNDQFRSRKRPHPDSEQPERNNYNKYYRPN